VCQEPDAHLHGAAFQPEAGAAAVNILPQLAARIEPPAPAGARRRAGPMIHSAKSGAGPISEAMPLAGFAYRLTGLRLPQPLSPHYRRAL
jgi:hypothetical protein